jgi:hypothetical protein
MPPLYPNSSPCIEGSPINAYGEVATTSFTIDFISASRKMLDACKKLSWWSKEAEILETSLTALEEELAKL